MRHDRIPLLCILITALVLVPTTASPQKPGQLPKRAPNLVVSSLSARLVGTNSVEYKWTITNVGDAPANLDGPTSAQTDNVSVQAYISKDTVFGNAGDLPAGGTIIGLSPLGMLAPHASRAGSFTATIHASAALYPYLVLKVDWGSVVAESNEDDNCAAVGIAR